MAQLLVLLLVLVWVFASGMASSVGNVTILVPNLSRVLINGYLRVLKVRVQ